MASSLLQLSHELLHCIFAQVEPYDLLNMRLTCKDFDNYIHGNRLLHQAIYQQSWDTPSDQLDWELQVQNKVKLNKILASRDTDEKEPHLGFVAEHIEHLLKTANPKPEESLNIKMLADYFDEDLNVDAFLTSSALFARAQTHPHRSELSIQLQQKSAKLHCLFGLPILQLKSKDPVLSSPAACTRQQTRPHQIHAYARAKVYDLREYTLDSLWGPFMSDGSQNVDWEKVEAILIDLAFNIRKFHENTQCRFRLQWTEAFQGITPGSFISRPLDQASAQEPEEVVDDELVRIRELALKLEQGDPYGVTGTWMRIVCFLDYNELWNFNFLHPMEHGGPRPPLDTLEGMIGIEERWRVCKIEPPKDEDDDGNLLDWSNFTGTRLPIVHFAGVSRSLHASYDPDANSKIRGTVRQTPQGEIRWTTFSIFHGEERWRSESVQLGGLRSARGVFGNWFDKDHSETGPAGPTAFWKESDNISDGKSRQHHWPYL